LYANPLHRADGKAASDQHCKTATLVEVEKEEKYENHTPRH
jgi:hypothetical protein